MQEGYDSTRPAAYLNYIVFDENFRVVKENSGALQVGGAGGQWNLLSANGPVTINQAGYIAVFASSRAASPVFFDKIDLTYYNGTVLEEDHYYPFGLTLSTQAKNATEKNNYKLTTKELQGDLDLNWYDFGARMQDEQIGRWTSVDPLAEKYSNESSYSFCRNNSILNIDRDGNRTLIYYIDENGHNAAYEYKSTNPIPNNSFVQMTVLSLDRDKLAGVIPKSVIDKISNDPSKTLRIVQSTNSAYNMIAEMDPMKDLNGNILSAGEHYDRGGAGLHGHICGVMRVVSMASSQAS